MVNCFFYKQPFKNAVGHEDNHGIPSYRFATTAVAVKNPLAWRMYDSQDNARRHHLSEEKLFFRRHVLSLLQFVNFSVSKPR